MSFFLVLFSAWCIIGHSQPYNQPLDEFVAAPDPYYSWNYTGFSHTGIGWDAYLINMTSQKWLNESYVNKPIWWHWLWIVFPKEIKHSDFATVVGTGGSNSHYDIQHAPSREDIFFISCQTIARDTGTICAALYNIPNQPLIFVDDPLQKSRSEDAIIAFGWHQFSYYSSSNDFRYNWLTHFPMVKATVRAMDTVAEYATQELNIPIIKRFGVSGASKRGWSAWLTGAADTRIEIMIPIVMDMCNFHPNLHHMFKSYNGWTWAFKDYYNENITADLDTEWFAELLEAADPYSFFDRYNERNIAKFIVDGTWDEFFMPDDEVYWWNDLKQPKYLLMNPDADHSQATAVETDIPSLTTFVGSYLNNIELPIINWDIADIYGNITLYFSGNTDNIIDVLIWHGRSCGRQRRDFRMLTLDSPCLCGIPNGEYCFNIESIFTPIKDIIPVIINDTYAEYHVSPPIYPGTSHWEAFMIGIKYHAFDKDNYKKHKHVQPNSFIKTKDGKIKEILDNEKADSWFLVQYGSIVWTSQISVVQQQFPFPDCTGAECKGTLV